MKIREASQLIRARNMSKKVTERAFLDRADILDKLINDEEVSVRKWGTKGVFKRHYTAGKTTYPIFVNIEIKDYLELQNLLLDIDPHRIWAMRSFVKFIIKWFIAYYSKETENPPFTKLKKKFITKEIRKLNEMFAEFMD